jgi:hypothetical protein
MRNPSTLVRFYDYREKYIIIWISLKVWKFFNSFTIPAIKYANFRAIVFDLSDSALIGRRPISLPNNWNAHKCS